MIENATLWFHGYSTIFPVSEPRSVMADVADSGVTLFLSAPSSIGGDTIRERLIYRWEDIYDVITMGNFIWFSGQPSLLVNNVPVSITANKPYKKDLLFPWTALQLSDKCSKLFCKLSEKHEEGSGNAYHNG